MLNRSSTVGTVFDPAMTATFEFEFERATRPGAATFSLVTSVGELVPLPQIMQLEISDPQHDPLQLGIEPAGSSRLETALEDPADQS